uniref:Uncharacterized protein n=1 Tax=Strigamia maritima TaxID=126957 RepID=T1JH27_STRMM
MTQRRLLRNGKRPTSGSKLQSLDVTLDESGVLKLCTRLNNLEDIWQFLAITTVRDRHKGFRDNWPTLEIELADDLDDDNIETHVESLQIINENFIFSKFSSFNRLKRVTTWMLRFAANARTIDAKTRD